MVKRQTKRTLSLRQGWHGHGMNPESGIAEKRAAKRYPFTITVMVQELSPERKTAVTPAIGAVSRNASDSGMCLSTATPLEYASVVRCDVSVGHIPISVPTMAQVRWVKRCNSGEYRSGVAYVL